MQAFEHQMRHRYYHSVRVLSVLHAFHCMDADSIHPRVSFPLSYFNLSRLYLCAYTASFYPFDSFVIHLLLYAIIL